MSIGTDFLSILRVEGVEMCERVETLSLRINVKKRLGFSLGFRAEANREICSCCKIKMLPSAWRLGISFERCRNGTGG